MENSFSDLAVHYSSEELLIMVYQFDQWDDEMLAAIQHQLLLRNLLPNDVLEKFKEFSKINEKEYLVSLENLQKLLIKAVAIIETISPDSAK